MILSGIFRRAISSDNSIDGGNNEIPYSSGKQYVEKYYCLSI
jgi:hypothetical protein